MEGRCRGGVMQTHTGTTSVSSIGGDDSAAHRQTPDIGLPRGGCGRTAPRCPSASAARNRACGTAGPCRGRWQISRAVVLDVHARAPRYAHCIAPAGFRFGHPATVRKRAQPCARREPGPAANARAIMLPIGFCWSSDMPHPYLRSAQTSVHCLLAGRLPINPPRPQHAACDSGAASCIADGRLPSACEAPSSAPALPGRSTSMRRSAA
ncbi:hypothetical protein ABZP12_02804 [Xanthomonas euvesicatoria]